MIIEITLAGKLEGSVSKEQFFDYMSDFSQRHQLGYHEYNDGLNARMKVCPEGVVECSFENDFVSLNALSNIAGPGFHAYVTTLFDDILENSGIAFEVEDPTGYYEKRDFQILKENYFHQWLEDIIDHIGEHRQGENMLIAWDDEVYVPKQRLGHVITPLGYIAYDDFSYDHVDDLARRFFIWNEIEKDASFYRNCALNLIWKHCYFKYSTMNEESSKAAYQIIDYLDVAYQMDPKMQLPKAVYHQLCHTMNCEDLLPEGEGIDEVIGYRQADVYYTFMDWAILASGFSERFLTMSNEEPELILNGPYENEFDDWNWVMNIKPCQDKVLDEEDFRFFENGVTCSGRYLQGEGYYGMLVYASAGTAQLELMIHYRNADSKAMLMNYLHNLRYQVVHDEFQHDVH